MKTDTPRRMGPLRSQGRPCVCNEPPGTRRYFIGQSASATAACGGKMVTNLPPTYCSNTGSASLFWPISSNFTRFHGHDGVLAGNVCRCQRFADLVAVNRLGAIDGFRHHDQRHELPRREVVEVLARLFLEHRVDLADHRPLGGEIERERAARNHAFELVADRVVQRLFRKTGVLRDNRARLVAEFAMVLIRRIPSVV